MPKPKHVVWITTDHMRYDCIAAHGNPGIHTPNLDRLVNHGVSFDRCYAQNPLCMPSRCSFMTGLYPQQTQVTQNGQTLDPNCPHTVAKAMKAAGYSSAQIGKLHFQPHEDNDLDPRARHDYGFDVMWLAEEPGCYEDAYMTWLRSEHPDAVPTFRIPRSCAAERFAGEEPRVLDAPWQQSFSGWIGTQFDRYMGTWGGRQDPQFVHLGFYAPHPPLNPTTEMFAPYKDRELPPRLFIEDGRERLDDPRRTSTWSEERFDAYKRHFYAMVTGVDMAVGQVLDQLEKMNVLDETLIIFGSDHGDLCGDHSGIGKGPSFYEGIMRLPLVMHWPKGLGSDARRVPGLVEMVDVMPTILGLCNNPIPPAMQGRDYSTALCAGETPEGRPDVYAYHGNGMIMLRNHEFKYLRYPKGDTAKEVLFDLSKDPEEFHDKSADPAYLTTLQSMRDRALQRSLAAAESPLPRTYRF